MKLPTLAGVALALFAAVLPARAGDDDALTRMALCKDSWLEWSKGDPARFKAFADHVRAGFTPHGNDPFALPKAGVSAAGLRVLQAFPQSVGMGVGFSLTVDAGFDDARKAVEKALGKPLAHCEEGEGMHDCELEVAPQRTVMVADDGGAKGPHHADRLLLSLTNDDLLDRVRFRDSAQMQRARFHGALEGL